jgi:phage N-6-adenine-methyltransferase
MKLNEPGYHKGDQSPEWETPQWLFDLLDDEFHFRLDVCATQENAKCKRHFTSEEDGLAQRWKGVCWMNPPYGHEIGTWMDKARTEADAGATIVCLVPARLDPEWMRTSARRAELRSIPGRLSFSGGGPAPFPSMVVIMRPSDHRDNPLFWDVWPPEEEKDNGLGEE